MTLSDTIPRPRTSYSAGGQAVWWVALAGMFFPAAPFSIGSVNVTAGRLTVILLLVPSIVVLFRPGRRLLGSDLFAVGFAVWITLASALNGDFKPYVAAEALEFFGAYVFGRAFSFGPANIDRFLSALKVVVLLVLAFSFLDTMYGRHVTMDAFGLTSQQSLLNPEKEYRFGLVRAASLLVGPEQNGAFNVMAASIFLYSAAGAQRWFYVGASAIGCVLALSSAPLMALALVASLFVYDRVMHAYEWRWKLVLILAILSLGAISLLTDDPIRWILVHITLDPQTGFFRLGTWNYALPLVEQSPLIGNGVSREWGLSDEARLYLWSVDCIWLVEALRYGLPAALLLFFTMFFSSFQDIGLRPGRASSLWTGFTLALVGFSFVGITVHFWDASWLFMALCVGVRASMAELHLRTVRSEKRGSRGTEPAHANLGVRHR